MRTTLLAILALGVVAPAQSELWVDANLGNDNNPGTAAQPVMSITQGLQIAQTGDTVFVNSGTYSAAATGEQIPLSFGVNTNHADVTVHGLGDVRLDFAGHTGNGLNIGNLCHGARITNLAFLNMDKSDWWTRAIDVVAGAGGDVEIDRCRFIDVNRGIVMWSGGPQIGWKIHDNLFLSLGNDAINEFDTAADNEIYNNTFANNPHLGVLSDTDLTAIHNNIFYGLRVGVASAAGASAAATRLTDNCFFNNQTDVQGNAFPGGLPAGNLTVDPQFVNAGADDLHLQASSPLIDAGRGGLFFRADLDNVSRAVDGDIDGSVIADIGCYEWTPVSLSVSATPGSTFSFTADSSTTQAPVMVVLLALDEGLIQLGGVSPILLDPATVLLPAFVGSAPLSASGNLGANIPAGTRICVQAFGYDIANSRLVGGPMHREQF